MLRRLIPVAAGVLAAPIALAVAAAHPVLVGTTGPGLTITVTMNGKKVTTLTPGAYTLVVHDKAPIHDFHLIGPGIDKVVTSVRFVGTKTITVNLRKGTYRYQCDPHAASGMKGSFVVS
jgi:plastocyanin